MDKIDIFYKSKTNTIILLSLIVIMVAGIVFVKLHPEVCFSTAFAKAQELAE